MLKILNEDGSLQPEPPVSRSPGTLLSLYRGMLRIRRLDEKLLILQREGRIGFYGACTGQEAAVIGSASVLEPTDWLVPAIREGGAALLRGMPLDDYLAQIFGNRLDLLRGRQMPCHYASRAIRHVSWSSCVGNQLPQAVGLAIAARARNDHAVVLACLGDGATSQGDFHCALHFAARLRAAVVFFCQNNQWAISTPVARQTASAGIAVKAESYGFTGTTVDGNDVLAVAAATRAAADLARSGGGPSLIEAVTYRMGPHSSSDDPSRYRDERITESWKARDPILRLRCHLFREKIWSDAQDKKLIAELDGEITAALARVEPAPPPEPASMFEDVYARK